MIKPYKVYSKEYETKNQRVITYRICYNRDCVAEYSDRKDADEICRLLNEAYALGRISR